MAAIIKPFLSNSQISSRTIATDITTTGTGFGVSANTQEVLLSVTVSSRTDGTFTPTIQGSIDGTTWITLKSGTAINSNTTNQTSWVVAKDGSMPPFIRAAVVSASTTTGATVVASIFVDHR